MTVAALLAATGCGRGDREDAARGGRAGGGGRLRIACTTTIVADLARAIGGTDADVVALIPAGVDPHTWRPDRAAREALASTDVLIVSGLGLEARAHGFIAGAAKDRTVIALADSIHPTHLLPLPADASRFDPHVWFDIEIWSRVSYLLGRQLGVLRPALADSFAARAQAYSAAMSDATGRTQDLLMQVPEDRRVLACTHDGGAYFARVFRWRYLSPERASIELADTRDPMVELLVSRRIPVLFATTIGDGATAAAMAPRAGARGHPVRVIEGLYLDSLAPRDRPAGTLAGAFDADAALIAGALRP